MPTLVMMHGLTGTAEMIRPLAESLLAPKMCLILPQALIPHPNRGFAWWLRDAPPTDPLDDASIQQVQDSVEMIVDLILRQAPDDDIILGGFSQGAAMALEVMQHPSIRYSVKGLILISGKVLRYQNVAKHLQDYPVPAVWMHGNRDEMVPMHQGIEVYDVLNEASCPLLELRHEKGHMVELSQKAKIVDWVSAVGV